MVVGHPEGLPSVEISNHGIRDLKPQTKVSLPTTGGGVSYLHLRLVNVVQESKRKLVHQPNNRDISAGKPVDEQEGQTRRAKEGVKLTITEDGAHEASSGRVAGEPHEADDGGDRRSDRVGVQVRLFRVPFGLWIR